MSLTTDPNDPRLHLGGNEKPGPQNEVYLVLSEEERAKGFVRPLRRAYRHTGHRPKFPLRDITPEENETYSSGDFVKFEPYPPSCRARGRYWTQRELDNHGCGTETKMGLALCETYARQPNFYGFTYCCGCRQHLPVADFVWVEDNAIVGT